MAEFRCAPIERGNPKRMQRFKSHPDFVPIHMYDFELLQNLGHGEIGMLMNPDGRIYKRLFYE